MASSSSSWSGARQPLNEDRGSGESGHSLQPSSDDQRQPQHQDPVPTLPGSSPGSSGMSPNRSREELRLRHMRTLEASAGASGAIDLEATILNSMHGSRIATPSHGRDKGHGHLHGPLDPQKALKTGGLFFAPIYNEMYNDGRVNKNKWIFGFSSVFLQMLVGALTGLAAFVVGFFSEKLTSWRLDTTVHMFQTSGWFAAFAVECCITLALGLVAALPVIFWAVTAGSSGIPAIVAILNGCDVRGAFQWKDLLVRLLGVTFAVSSGLAVGPEGPMIYVGACIGAILSNVPSSPRVWNYFGRPPNSLNHGVYLRDYISTGAACGIAAAFRAPIAGTLFIVEEAASHFKREQLAKIFLAGMVALVVAGFFGYQTGASFVFEYKVATGDGCVLWNWLQTADIFLFVIIGVVCGLAGALFNHINVAICTFRAKHINAKQPGRRLAEIILICVLTSFFWTFLPSLYSERSTSNRDIFDRGTSCMREEWMLQIAASADVEKDSVHNFQGFRVRYQPQPCFYGVQYNPMLCPQAHDLAANVSAVGRAYARTCLEASHLKYNPDVPLQSESYCCNFTSLENLQQGIFQLPSNASCSIDLGDGFPSMAQEGDMIDDSQHHHSYNPMASLTLVPFERVAQNLFSRGAPYVFPMPVMLLFLPVFFLLAAITAGSAVPSGLLLPMILTGALIGRVLSLLMMKMQLETGWYEAVRSPVWASTFDKFFHYEGGPLDASVPLTTGGWMDPGIGALVGAGAFLGGTSRISLFVTVMMVEITGDPMMIAPVGIATLVAVIVGNRFNHGIYHSLMDVASMPFLPDRWPKEIPKALRVEHLLISEEVLADIVTVRMTADRDEVSVALEGNEYGCFPVVGNDGVVVGLAYRASLNKLLESSELEIDVGCVTDFNYVTIRESLPLEVAFNLFKRMEISHMVVVDDHHKPRAMLTRASLLPWNVEQTIGPRRLNRVRPTIQRPRILRATSQDAVAADDPTGTFHRQNTTSSSFMAVDGERASTM